MTRHVRIPLLIAVVLALSAAPASAATPAYKDARKPVAKRVSDLLSRMTLEDKVGQMTQAERAQFDKTDEPNPSDNDDLITTWRLGSILSGGGSTPAENTPKAWADMVDRYQRRALATPLGIPLIYGIDSVHGDGNMLGATVFPHNIGLGATRDPRLVRDIEHITASETRSTGPQWSFAPCICAARDDRWGRTYESFSEDPRLVEKFETAIDGLQGSRGQLKDRDRVLATAKHFAGDGDTQYGTGNGDYTIDQGITVTNRRDFWNTSLRQYLPAVQKHHVGSVMPSYSSVDWTEDGVGTNVVNMHGNRELITDVLKGKMHFGGFVISDYEGLNHITGGPTDPSANRDYQITTGVNAGIDMIMEPNNYQDFETRLIRLVKAGDVPMSRIDDAVSRILAKKFELGLFEHPFTNRADLAKVGSPAHRGGRPPRRGEVAGAAEEQAPHAAALQARRRLRHRQQRQQHRQPGRRLDADVAGRLEERHPRRDDPRRDPQRHAWRRDFQPGRVGAGAEARRRRRRGRRDAVLRGLRRHRRPAMGLRPR